MLIIKGQRNEKLKLIKEITKQSDNLNTKKAIQCYLQRGKSFKHAS